MNNCLEEIDKLKDEIARIKETCNKQQKALGQIREFITWQIGLTKRYVGHKSIMSIAYKNVLTKLNEITKEIQ
jgi:hypothetical protein